MLSVIYLSMLQHKLVFFLPHGNFTESLSVGVVTRDKLKWFQQTSLPSLWDRKS